MKIEKSEYRAKVRISRDEAELLGADIDYICDSSFQYTMPSSSLNTLVWLKGVLDNLCFEEADAITLIVKGDKSIDG